MSLTAFRNYVVTKQGSGISGLTAAWALKKLPGAHVTMYERADHPGIDAGSVMVGNDRIDLPLRVFSRDYYPNLLELYRTVDVSMSPEDYSSSFRERKDANDDATHCFFRYYNIFFLGWSISAVSGLRLFSLQFFRMAVDVVSFFFYARAETMTPQGLKATAKLTLGEWLAARGFSEDFSRLFMLPTMAAVCTCSYDAVLNYPADLVLVYLRDKLHVGVVRATNGTYDVADRLSRGVDKFVLRTSIDSVAFNPVTRQVRVTPRHGQAEEFDHVIMATQANTAAHLLDGQSYPAQLAALRSFAYESSSVVLHTDPRLMPPRRSDWSSLNLLVDHSRTMPMATIWMNQAQKNLPVPHNVFQTWNPLDVPAADLVLGTGHFERPVIDHTSRAAQVTLEGMQGLHGVWFAGAYVKQGIPLLEAGCTSALEIAEALGFECPWWVTQRQAKNLADTTQAATSAWFRPLAALAPWVQAGRPLCYFMLALPLVLGQAFGVQAQAPGSPGWSTTTSVLLLVMLALHQCALLWLNDAADHSLDDGNATFDSLPGIRVSGGSRVVQQGKLSPLALATGAFFAFLLYMLLAMAGAVVLSLPWLPVFTLLWAFTAVGYSLPPLHAAQRGRGELLQGLGMLLLFGTGFYAQNPTAVWPASLPYAALAAIFFVFYSSHIVTALPDAPSDRAGGRETFVVRYGERTARRHVLTCLVLAAVVALAEPALAATWSVSVGVGVAVAAVRASAYVMRAPDVAENPQACALFVLCVSVLQAVLMSAWTLALVRS